jgi:hypothetical protein
MTLRQFLLETLAIFVGDVLATAFIALIAYLAWRVLKYPGFRVGASWAWEGWNVQQMGRFPTASDSGPMLLRPQISITSYETSVKKVIHSVWVRQHADPQNPGTILGHRDLQREGVAAERRTTGADPLHVIGPEISADASRFQEIVNFPVFVQTTDGAFYKAESVGNAAEGMNRFRYRARNALYRARRQASSLLGYIREHIFGNRG